MAEREFRNDDLELTDESSDSSYEELLQDWDRNVAISYRFEPTVSASDASETDSSESEDDFPLPRNDRDRVENTNWCTCGHCLVMPTDMESTFCREVTKISEKEYRDGLELSCVREHPAFDMLVLNTDVLGLAAINTSSLWRTKLPSPLTDTLYRLTTYRQFTLCVNGPLGRKHRRVVPSCVVRNIRDKFPALEDGQDTYVGFMLAD